MSSSDENSHKEYEEETDYDSEDEEEFAVINELCSSFNNLKPYEFEPSDEYTSDSSSEFIESKSSEHENRVGNTSWCSCEKCCIETREVDCLCCKEVPAISEKQFENHVCVTDSIEYSKLCLEPIVLKNVLVGFHETKGDPLEQNVTNKSMRFAAYKQFIWWIFQRLGKGNRRVIPACVLWKIRNRFPEGNGKYKLYSEGEKD